MNGAKIILKSLVDQGVDTIFGYPGGATLPIYDELFKQKKLKHILVRHEQGAAHAADGYSRSTGKVGVAFATSGPGATNLITGLATAMMDSAPLVAITGQVGRSAIGTDAFQETDITGATLPVTKHNYLVMRADDIGKTIHEAFHIARTGRPGPVLIDIPKDVFQEEAYYDPDVSVTIPGYTVPTKANLSDIVDAVDLINNSDRPVILAGHGVIISKAHNELKTLSEKSQIPVVTTLLGISSFPEDHILSCGFPGMHGMAYASLILDQSDLIIGIGTRFDDRIVGDPKRFSVTSKKIHIDIDKSEIGKTVKIDAPVIGNIRDVLKQMNPKVFKKNRPEWIGHMEDLKRQHPSLDIPKSDHLLGQRVISCLLYTSPSPRDRG